MDDTSFNANVQYLLGKLDGKVDTVLANQVAQSADIKVINARLSDGENRLTTLETETKTKTASKTFILSMISVLVAITVAVSSYAKSLFR